MGVIASSFASADVEQIVSSLLSSIPSPSQNSIKIGPFQLNAYGLCIGIGVLVAAYMGQKRWAERGGDPEDVFAVATWAVPAGVIGTRLYHVITDLRPISEWYKIWEGGLGIPGGLIAGVLAGYVVARKRGLDVPNFVDAVIPGVPVAQAIGRLGNWFNQEVFGGPTDLPWAVEIDEKFRPAEYQTAETFHPAFLYEGLWNLGLAYVLIRADRTGKLKRGMILPLFVGGYGIGRFLVESVRVDPASRPFLDIRINHVMSVVAIIGAALALKFLFDKAKPSFWSDDATEERVAALAAAGVGVGVEGHSGVATDDVDVDDVDEDDLGDGDSDDADAEDDDQRDRVDDPDDDDDSPSRDGDDESVVDEEE